MKKALIAILGLSLAGIAAYAAVNIGGAWDFTMTTQRGEQKSVVTFVQDGEKLSVTVAGIGRDGQPMESKGEGTIKGNDVTWKIIRETPRGTMESTYKGTLMDANNMKGTMEFGGNRGGGNPPGGNPPSGGGQMTPPEWTAVRQAK
ncbi:MAG: hypothetical protein PHI34_01895 [Acidobacteriota bacterium]|nr:hypothetical protein [Acidobacteriota bacterium]